MEAQIMKPQTKQQMNVPEVSPSMLDNIARISFPSIP